MKKIELTKYGFVRSKEDDFTDDGTRFTCYRVGNILVSKAASRCTPGLVFIDADLPWEENGLTYDMFSKLPHYKQLSRLNGCRLDNISEQDLIQLHDDCVSYEREYNELLEQTKFPTMDELKDAYEKIKAQKVSQLEEANKLLKDNALDVLLKVPDYVLHLIREYYNMLKSQASINPNERAQKVFKTRFSFDTIEESKKQKDNYELTNIKDYLRKYLGKSFINKEDK